MPIGETKLMAQDTARVNPYTKYSLPKNKHSSETFRIRHESLTKMAYEGKEYMFLGGSRWLNELQEVSHNKGG